MLTDKQTRFCTEYIKDSNAAAAARRAGYSAKCANRQGSKLLQDAEVQARIAELQAGVVTATGVQIETVVQELVKLAFSDITSVVQMDGNKIKVKDFSELSPAQKAAIAEISETQNKYGVTRKIKMHSKISALDMLMKHLGGYMTAAELIDKLPPERLDALVTELLTRLQK